MKTYTVEYLLDGYWDVTRRVEVQAHNKAEAHAKAVWEVIPQMPDNDRGEPYSAWVVSVRYSNGKTQDFNTYDGEPY